MLRKARGFFCSIFILKKDKILFFIYIFYFVKNKPLHNPSDVMG